MSIVYADPLNERDDKTAGAALKRILVVDDEEMVRAFAAMALEEEGYVVHQAGDASEAAYVWSREEGMFDLLLADVSLPGQSGVELAENLRALNPDLPIVFASGYDDAVVAESLPGTGKTAYLPKPYSMKGLVEAVGRALPVPPAKRL